MFGIHLNGKLNPMFGRKHSEGTKEKIRQKRLGVSTCKGIPKSEEHCRKISETKKRLFLEGKFIAFMKGKHHSLKSRNKLSKAQKDWQKTHPNPFLGRKHTEETKKLMREAR